MSTLPAVNEGALGLLFLLVASIARAAARGGRRFEPEAGEGVHEEASRLSADLVWAAFILPGLLLSADAAPRLLPAAGRAAGFAAALLGALVVAGALPDLVGRRAAAAPWTGSLRRLFGLPFRPVAARLVRHGAAHPPAEPAAADEAMLLKRLLDEATGEKGAPPELEPSALELLIGRVLRLRETPVHKIMQPRERVVWVGHRERPGAAALIMRESGHSRIPVAARDLDDVVGILHLKDVFLALNGVPAAGTAGSLRREATFVGDEERLSGLLAQWRRGGGTMAVVRDRGGRVAGIVTLRDVIEWLLADQVPALRPAGANR